MSTQNDAQLVKQLGQFRQDFLDEIGKVIIGQQNILDHFLIALICKGHTLLVGVPGLAKTLLIKSMAELLDLKFSRIQFTPDLMPSDITGTEVIPVFGNIILADEINRTPPKTQSALLQAMQEHNVTAGGETYTLDEPFFVLATQNPIEQEGTYPLPEAQLDRFMFNIKIDYPSRDEEVAIVQTTTSGSEAALKSIISKDQLLTFQELVRRVPVAENVVEYAVDLVRKTRSKAKDSPDFIQNWIDWGAGPRASQYLILGAKGRAILDGRPTPDISDVNALALPVLRHRLITNFNAEAEGVSVDDIILKLLG